MGNPSSSITMKEETYKKSISKLERLQLIGVVTLASQAYKRQRECDKAICKIINYKGSDYPGLLGDIYFDESPDVDECIKNMGIKVK